MSNPTSIEHNTHTVTVERTFPYPPEKLWRALTESPLLAQWMLPNDFEPVPGRSFQLRNQPMPQWDGVIECEVLEIDPFRKLSYRWSALGLDSVVLWTLTPTEGGTHVRMEHSGFSADQQAAFKGATYGWRNFFAALERVLGGTA